MKDEAMLASASQKNISNAERLIIEAVKHEKSADARLSLRGALRLLRLALKASQEFEQRTLLSPFVRLQ